MIFNLLWYAFVAEGTELSIGFWEQVLKLNFNLASQHGRYKVDTFPRICAGHNPQQSTGTKPPNYTLNVVLLQPNFPVEQFLFQYFYIRIVLSQIWVFQIAEFSGQI